MSPPVAAAQVIGFHAHDGQLDIDVEVLQQKITLEFRDLDLDELKAFVTIAISQRTDAERK